MVHHTSFSVNNDTLINGSGIISCNECKRNERVYKRIILGHCSHASSLSLSLCLVGLLSFPSHSFLHSAHLFSSHADNSLTFFPLTFFAIFPNCDAPLILSFLILSRFVSPHIHHIQNEEIHRLEYDVFNIIVL